MEIRLNCLRLKNFKGVKDFTLKIDGSNATVYGDNGTGKTTLMDAFLWLLFNKDSTDRTSFSIRPQDKEGKDIHYLQTEVEAGLKIDSGVLWIRKLFEEKWTKKRGAEEAELTGNTISYWWNEVPVKEKEYKEKIGELIDENIFRMLTNPFYFNQSLKWQDRRRTLLEMCGDMTDEDVINADVRLAKLKDVLGSHNVDDYKKVVAEKIKRYEKERADIPPRIDELTLSLPEEGQDYIEVEKALQNAKLELQGIDERISRASTIVNEFGEKQRELSRLKNQLEDLKNTIDKRGMEDSHRLSLKKYDLENNRYSFASDKKTLEKEMASLKLALEQNGIDRKTLLEEWNSLSIQVKETAALEFVEPDADSFICPACRQALPDDDIETKLQNMRDNFEEEKQSDIMRLTSKLERNKSEGLNLKKNTVEKENRIKGIQGEVLKAETGIKKIDKELEKINEAIGTLSEATPDYNSSPEYIELQGKIETMEAELEKPYEDTTSRWLKMKDEVMDKINEYNSILYSKGKAEETRKRIEELIEEEKRIATLISELEGHKYLLEQFIVSKVNMLEDKINSHFKEVKFKMFDVQINGGISETCEALVNTNGCYVPFVDANHAGKVNAGIDCINALSKFYEVTAPIFIDFRESVSKLIDTDSQIINLFKSEKDKKLRVELEVQSNGELSDYQNKNY